MPSVDFRTRTDADVTPVDAAAFFGDVLPRLIAEHAELAVPGARELAPRPLAIEVHGESWTLRFTGRRDHGRAGFGRRGCGCRPR